ncbi:MAG: hypothetical protein KAI29_01230, partial [Cyclobacteriaceae bacterium]|nr:hypothetical protein [Cyclobacteriaceae bacterium]
KIIGKYYNHPFRIATQEEIKEAISSGDKNIAYLHYLWSDHERMFQGVVINAENSEVLQVFKVGAIKFSSKDCPPVGSSYRDQIMMKVKRLKGLSR